MSGGSPLTGRVAIVTGASRGIGAAVVDHLRLLGATVAAHHHQRADDQRADDQTLLFGDVADDARALVTACVERFGRLDIVVNNAALQSLGALVDLSDADVAEMLRVNVLGVTAMTSAAAAVMQAGGAICNVASIEAFGAPPSGHSHYVTSKAAVVGHTKAAAVELGPRGIRVNAVAPGLISRPGIETAWPEGVARWQAACPLTRLGTPDDVARAVGFLVGPDASWITGTCLVIDGGVSARTPW